jgi:hypothetical protein
MGDGFGAEIFMTVNKGSTPAIVNIMIHIAESFLQIGKVCILEANFRPPHDMQIARLLEKHDADCLTYLFVGDMEVFWERYVQREAERHWALSVAGQNRERFINEGIKAGFGNFEMGDTVKVDSTDFSKIYYDSLIALANKFIINCH